MQVQERSSVSSIAALEAAGVRSFSWKAPLLVAALLAVNGSRFFAPNIHRDWLNVVPAVAAIYLAYAVVTWESPRWLWFSRWIQSLALVVLILATFEFGLRTVSYHRALLYQRQGNLLFTPLPNQEYTEKVSLSSSKTNDLGLRGPAVDLRSSTKKILALGDSVTYGYGLDDDHTYPAMLQKALDTRFPGQFTVINGGVNAYPVSFEHQKFLYLWERGFHPDVVLVGYSFNEGRLGHLVDSDEKTKTEFAHRVEVKNFLRTFALYNVIVENWARWGYDKMTRNMVPGTNFTSLSQEDVDVIYAKQLQDFVDDLHAHDVKPVFLLFCGYDARIDNYDDVGPYQKVFRSFAETHGIPLLRSKEGLLKNQNPGEKLGPYFQDLSHMKPGGTAKLAEFIADSLPSLEHQSAVAH